MERLSPEVLLLLAKKTLSLASSNPDAAAPKPYLEELKKHVNLYPHDTNYILSLEPGRGLGTLTCLEDGCDRVQIKLIARVSSPDGGKATGLGSLSTYRAHIANHPTHMKSRHARVKAELGIVSRPNTNPSLQPSPSTPKERKPSILNALDANLRSVLTPPSSSTATHVVLAHRILPSMSRQEVKEEPSEPSIPRKRASDAALVAEPFRKDETHAPSTQRSPPTFKKPKIEMGKTPLALVNRNPAVIPDAPVVPSVGEQSIANTREKLSEVQSQMSHIQAMLSKARRKQRKSKADHTRIVKLENEMRGLQALKDKHNASIPSAKPLSRANSMNQPIASGSNIQIPPAMDVKSFALGAPPPGMNIIHPMALGSSSRILASRVKTEAGAVDLGSIAPEAYLSEDEQFDENGDFHGKGRDLFAGPSAKADDIDKFLMAAGNAEQFDGNASVGDALKKLRLPDLFTLLRGMEIALMPHQAIGVAWMLDKEKGPNKGGCLADEMGLGKTVQTIAVIATNPSDDPLRKSTLILAPVALLNQWQQEIEMKTNLGLKCLIYHGSSKPKNIDEVRKYDIVLTTFQTLAFEWPDAEAEDKERAKKKRKKLTHNDGFIVDDDEDVKPKRKGRMTVGLLFEIDWHRICIDEAQNIRNKRTRISRAVTKLEAKYRWCLTGTPIINGLSDAYGLLRFLRIRPWYDWDHFNPQIARIEKKRPDLATIRLQAIFATTLLRRKKDSMLDGKRLVELPAKNVHLLKLEFSKEERDIYQMVEAKSQAIFNRFLRAGTVLKNYHQVLVMLLRLRQICSHPSLILEEGGDAFISPDEAEADGSDTYRERSRAARLVSDEFVVRMKYKLKEIVLERMAAEKESADAILEGEECPICYDNFTDAVVTSCTHVFCRECIHNVLNTPARLDANEPNQYKADERPCPTCRGAITKEKLFYRSAFEPTEAELNVDGAIVKVDEDIEMIDVQDKGKGKAKEQPRRSTRKRKSRPMRVLDSDEEEDDEDDDDDDMSDFIIEIDEDEEMKDARREEKRRLHKGKARATVISDDEEDGGVIFGAKPPVPVPAEKVKSMPKFLPSTKMKKMMDSLRAWAEAHPDEKTLIVSQWTQCLSLVSHYLTENGFGHVKYQGDMSRHQRDQAVRVFMSKDKAMVMLMSLKCGGVGLNLTRANRVISLDLGWSEAIESQAFDRVHRLGQTRSVTVERLVISDTVEDRVLALQERKKNLADGSLGEGNGKKVGRLSVKELANLFGLDHRGRLLSAN